MILWAFTLSLELNKIVKRIFKAFLLRLIDHSDGMGRKERTIVLNELNFFVGVVVCLL